MKGFGHRLTDEEGLLLKAFDHNGELVMPHAALKGLIKRQQVEQLIKSMNQRGLLTVGKPYKLTRLGKRLKDCQCLK